MNDDRKIANNLRTIRKSAKEIFDIVRDGNDYKIVWSEMKTWFICTIIACVPIALQFIVWSVTCFTLWNFTRDIWAIKLVPFVMVLSITSIYDIRKVFSNKHRITEGERFTKHKKCIYWCSIIFCLIYIVLRINHYNELYLLPYLELFTISYTFVALAMTMLFQYRLAKNVAKIKNSQIGSSLSII